MKTSRTLLLALIGFIFTNQKIVAQNTSIPEAMDSCFMYVDLSTCSTNVLINKGFPTSNPLHYTGNISTCQPATVNDWWDMYKCMYYGRTTASTWSIPTREQLLENISTLETGLLSRLTTPNTAMGEVAKISLIYADYNHIVPNPSSTPYYTQNNLQQLIDNPNRTSNPYSQDLLVAAGNILKVSTTGAILFVVPSNLYMSNKTAISNLTISADFTGGGSYTSLTPDLPYLYNYSSIGVKTITIKIVDGSNTYYAKTIINIKNVYSSASSFLGKTLCLTPCFDAIWRDWQTQSGGTQYSNAAGYLIFSSSNTTIAGGTLKLRKPVIVIEGQDPLNNFVFANLFTLINEGPNNSSGLIQRLHAQGHDVIILDYLNTYTRDMRNLSEVLRRLIKYVNQNLDPQVENNKLTVAGVSMGGVVARYTLAKMEQTYCENHNVELYISYDAPHKGANVPVGFQALTVQAYSIALDLISADIALAYYNLNAPVTRDLLNAYWSNSTFNPTSNHTSFYSELDQLGMPQKCRTVGLSLGNTFNNAPDNANGFPGNAYNAGDNILNYSRTGELNVTLTVRAANNTTSQSVCDLYAYLHYKIEVPWWLGGGWLVPSTVYYNPILINSYANYLSPLPYDNAPDSYLETGGALAEGLGGNATTNDRPQTNIVSAASALNLRNVEVYHVNESLTTIRNNKTHSFDQIYMRNDNFAYFHVGVYPDLSNNIYNEIINTNANTSGFSASLPLINIGGQTYNFGAKSYYQTLYNATVGVGGLLQFNGNFGVNYNGTGSIPVTNSTYQISTGICTSTITINNGGQMILGDASSNNKAIVNIMGLNTLILKSGSELIINGGSLLKLQLGAQLIVEPGAIINLVNNNSILEVEGFITLTTSAIFQPTGLGFCRFINNTGVSNTHFFPQGSNQIIFDGTTGSTVGNFRKVLEIKGNYGLVIPSDDIDLFKINVGKVFLEPNNVLEINADNYLILNAEFDKLNSFDANYKGILVYGSPIDISNQFNLSRIQSTKIKNAQIGIEGQLWVKGNGLRLNDVHFYSCDLGLKTVGKNIYWLGGVANNCGSVWEGFTLDAPSTIFGVNVNASGGPPVMYTGIGIVTMASSAAPVYIENCKIHNYSTGIYATGNDIYLKCSDVTNNYKGVLLDFEGKLVLDNTTSQAGFNNISNNFISIHPSNNSLLELQDGYSNINSSNPFDPTSNSLGITQTLFNSPGEIGGWNNYYGSFTTPFYFDVNLGIASYLAPINVTPSISIGQYNSSRQQSCNYSGGGGEEYDPGNGGLGKTGGNFISTSRLQNKTILQAFNISNNFIRNKNDSLRNYNTAIDYFDDILSLNYITLTNSEKKLLQYSYCNYMSSLGGAIQKRQVNVSRKSTLFNNQIQKVINRQNLLLQKAASDSLWLKLKNKISLDKAVTYRASENRNKSIQLLDSILMWAIDTNYILLVNTWKCQIQAERDFITGVIKNKDSINFFYPCFGKVIKRKHKPFNSLRSIAMPTTSINETSLINSKVLAIYPNPAQNLLNVEFETKSDYTLEILDANGKLLFTKFGKSLNTNNAIVKETLDIKDLISGFYLIKVNCNNLSHLSKFIIE